MPNGLNNWVFRDVERFLKHHGFYLVQGKDIGMNQKGSHYLYFVRKEGNKEAIVDTQYKTGSESYPPRTLETLIGNAEPFVDKKEWRRWAITGGYCCKGIKAKEQQALPTPNNRKRRIAGNLH